MSDTPREQDDGAVQLPSSERPPGPMPMGWLPAHLLSDVLGGHPLFRRIPPERRAALAREFQLRARAKGTSLLEQGKPVDALYLLLRGRCQVLHHHPDGGEKLLRTLEEGDVFGEISLMLGLTATATVRAETTCLLLRLDWGSCDRFLMNQPGLCDALSRMSNERLLYSSELFLETPAPSGASGPRASGL